MIACCWRRVRVPLYRDVSIVVCLALLFSASPPSLNLSSAPRVQAAAPQPSAAAAISERPEQPARNLRAAAAAERQGTLIGAVTNAANDSPLAGVQVVAAGAAEELPPYRAFLPVVAKRRSVATSDVGPTTGPVAVAAGLTRLSSSVVLTTTTAADGSFSLAAPAGAYTLTLTLANFGLDRRTATVRANEISRVADVRLHALDPVVAPVGAAGGSVTNSLGNTSLQFPAGALSTTQQARVTFLANSALPGFFADGSAPMGFAGLEPEGLVFPPGKEVLWTVAYTGTLPVGTDTLCYWWDGKSNRWRDPVPGKVVDLGGGKKALQARVTHFSAYGHALPGIAGQQPGGGQASVTTANGGQGTCQTNCKGSQLNMGTGAVSESYAFATVSSQGLPILLALRYSSANDTPTVTARVPFTITSQWPARAEWVLDFQGKTYTGAGYDARAEWDTRNGLGYRVAPGPYDFNAWETFYYDSGAQPTLAVSGTVEVRRGDISPFGFNWLSSYDTLLVNRSSTVTIIQGDGQYLTYTRQASGSYAAPPGDYSTLVLNPDGTWTRTSKYGWVEQFNVQGRLTRLQDRNGNAQTLTYELTGVALPPGAWELRDRLVRITDASGQALSLSYGADGYVARVTDPAGRIYQLAHDAAGNLTSITDPLGRTTTYRYDAGHLLAGYTYPEGNGSGLAYDAGGRLVQRTDALGGVRTTTYGASSTSLTDERGNTTTYTPNAYGAIERVTDPIRTTQYTWDSERRLLAADPPPARLAYDQRGNVTEEITYGRTATEYATSFSQPISQTDMAGNITRFAYDNRGNLSSITDPLGGVYRFEHDDQGQLVHAVNPLGQATAFVYDGRGQLLRSIDPLGRTLALEYDATGNLTSLTDAANHITRFAYDAADRLTGVTNPLGGVTQFAYDRNDNLTHVTDASGHVTTYSYDALDRLTAETDPLGHRTSYAYDGASNRVSRTNADGVTVQYSYDGANRLTAEQLPGGNRATYGYDVADNLTSYLDANVQITHTYQTGIPSQPDVVETRLLSNPAVRSVVSYDYVALGGAATAMQGSRGAEDASAIAQQRSRGAETITPPRSPDLALPQAPSPFTSPVASTSTLALPLTSTLTLTSTFPTPSPTPSTPTPYREVGRSASAPYTDVCGSISSNTTWTLANSPYVATCSVYVNAGVSLTLEPGVVVKPKNLDTIISIYGTLVARGTPAQPIILTSYKDDTAGGDTNGDGSATTPAAGDWRALVFNGGSSGSVLERAEVRYGGQYWGYGVYVNTPNISITDSTFRWNNGLGISFDGAMPPTLTRNRFTGNTTAAAWLHINGAPSMVLDGNQATGNGVNGLVVEATIAGNTTWDGDDAFPFVINGLGSNAGTNLTLTPGTIVKFKNPDTIASFYGALVARGTAAQPIIFTSFKDDAVGGDTNNDGSATSPAAGDWRALVFNGGSTGSVLEQVEARYGGQWWGYGVYVGTPNITITDSTFRSNNGLGIFFEGAMPATLTHNRFTGNTTAAAWLRMNGAPSMVLDGNQATGNGVNGLVIEVNVTGNATWDGDDAFPFVINGLGSNAGTNLTLTPGTIVKFKNPDTIASFYGALVARGTVAQPIIFTSFKDDAVGGDTNNDGSATTPAAGDWRALVFNGSSTGSVLERAEVRYSGQWWGYAVYVGTPNITLTDSTFRANNGLGIFFEGAIPATLTRNRFIGNSTAAAWLRMTGAPSMVLDGNQATGNGVNGLVVDATIAGNTTWDGDDAFPFVINGLTGNGGASLTLTPGTIVKFKNPDTIASFYGALVARGTADRPIIFTSFKDDAVGGDTNGDGSATTPAAGDWRALVFNGSSTGSVLEQVEVRYGGQWWGYGVYVGTPNITLTDSIFKTNNGNGIFFEGAMPATLTRNRFIGNSGAAAWLSMNSAASFALDGNQATGNGVNGFVVNTAVSADVTWDGDDGLPFVAYGLGVNRGGRLTLTPGTVVKFWYPDRAMGIAGTLIARGTADRPIVFSSLRDDAVGGDTNGDGGATLPAPGDWNNLRFEYAAETSGNVLEHVVVRYGGQWWHENIYVNNTDLTLTDSTISDAIGNGLSLDSARVTITGSSLTGNSARGIWAGGNTTATIHGSRFIGNGQWAIENTGSNVFNAEQNWWGSPTGPYDPSDDRGSGGLYNPGGTGGKVSDRVDYQPWQMITGLVYGTTIATGANPVLTLRYSYDVLNRLSKLTAAGPTSLDYRFGYDAAARLTTAGPVTGGHGISLTLTYDAASRLTRLTSRAGGATVSDASYTYDNAGNLTTLTDGAGATSFSYDAANRLTAANGPGLNETYGYDGTGNRTRKGSINYTYDAANQLTAAGDGTTYTYDPNGNLRTKSAAGQVTTYSWDAHNRLVRIDYPDATFSAYTYDNLGHRLSKRDRDGKTTCYVYDGLNLVQEVDAAGKVLAHYVYAGADYPLSMTRDGATYYYVLDYLRSVIGLVDDAGRLVAGYRYDPWGNVIATSGSNPGLANPLRFTSQVWDAESGLYYLRARYYDSLIGRFISRDPLRASALGWNAYAYAGNNPVNATDTLGLFGLDNNRRWWQVGVGLLAGLAAGAIVVGTGGIGAPAAAGLFLQAVGAGVVAGGTVGAIHEAATACKNDPTYSLIGAFLAGGTGGLFGSAAAATIGLLVPGFAGSVGTTTAVELSQGAWEFLTTYYSPAWIRAIITSKGPAGALPYLIPWIGAWVPIIWAGTIGAIVGLDAMSNWVISHSVYGRTNRRR